MDNGEFNIEERVLCCNEACIGLVGKDGKCKVCGLVYTGNESLPKTDDETAIEPNQVDEAKKETEANSKTDDNTNTVDAFENERICCSDEACIGIIGPSGTCGTCGKVQL